MVELLVVADDLTGATDTGVRFAQRGIPTRVIVAFEREMDGADRAASVLVVETRSRHVEPAEAGRRVAEVVRRGREAGIPRFFKKTDSTLRGNVGAELQALLLASGEALLGFFPAFPSQGRTTAGGVQLVHGRPLHRTEFGADPLNPVRAASIAELLRRQTDLPIVPLGGADLERRNLGDLPERAILVFDAGSDDDLRRAVDWLGRRRPLSALAGTAALASVLAERDAAGAGWIEPSLPHRGPGSPMLVVAGSVNATSVAQVEHAAARGFATVAPPPAALTCAEASRSQEAVEAVAAAADLLRSGRSVILRSARGRADVEACLASGAERGIQPPALHLLLARNLGWMATRVLAESRVPIVTVLGGDTLAGLVEAFGNPALIPRRELIDGVPVSELEGFEGLLVASKAGGFGSETLLVRLGELVSVEAS